MEHASSDSVQQGTVNEVSPDQQSNFRWKQLKVKLAVQIMHRSKISITTNDFKHCPKCIPCWLSRKMAHRMFELSMVAIRRTNIHKNRHHDHRNDLIFSLKYWCLKSLTCFAQYFFPALNLFYIQPLEKDDESATQIECFASKSLSSTSQCKIVYTTWCLVARPGAELDISRSAIITRMKIYTENSIHWLFPVLDDMISVFVAMSDLIKCFNHKS